MRVLSVLLFSGMLSAQAPPIVLPGAPLVGFASAWGGGCCGPDGRPDLKLGHSCAASYTVDPSSAPITTSASQGGLRVFFVSGGNCGFVRPRSCSFRGSLRTNSSSAREVEICPPGVPLGSPSCIKIPAGSFHRFSGISITLSCDTTRNTETMEFSYFDPASASPQTGKIRFVCEVCN